MQGSGWILMALIKAAVAWVQVFKEGGPAMRQSDARVKHDAALVRSPLRESSQASGWLFLALERAEDRGDDAGLLDDGDALHAAIAMRVGHHIHPKHLQQQLRPRHPARPRASANRAAVCAPKTEDWRLPYI